ncbi:MAG: antirestriction protein ArdA [Ruminococcus flavefaciens]|nr:antirestriction protein ArdA [Ruminococcus flavefaciens]MCM1060088.1 antirestriction protein ArdA [Eubacterium sp.]
MELTAHEPKSTTKTKKQQSHGLKTEVNIMMTTTTISVFLNTWANYNKNGADGGFWVDLPCNLDETLERLAASTGEEVDEMEAFINDFETEIKGLEISEYSNIEELNDLAESLDDLDEYDIEKIDAIMEAYGGTLENAIENIDEYTYYSGMTLEDVAYELVDERSELSEFAKRYFDYEAFARDLEIDGYYETSNGVICK